MTFLINIHLLIISWKLNEEFLRRPLGTIGDDVFEIGEILERLPQPMIECLTTVKDCKDYIFWLRKEVKGGYSLFIYLRLSFNSVIFLLTFKTTDNRD